MLHILQFNTEGELTYKDTQIARNAPYYQDKHIFIWEEPKKKESAGVAWHVLADKHRYLHRQLPRIAIVSELTSVSVQHLVYKYVWAVRENGLSLPQYYLAL